MSVLPAEEEMRLLRDLRSSDERLANSAQTRILSALQAPLRFACLGVCGNETDADDALQNALFAVARGLIRFRGDSRLYTWAYRIAVRAAVEVKAQGGIIERGNNKLSLQLHSPPTLPTSDAETLQILEKLPLDLRLSLVLFALGGFSHKEIAEMMGVAEGTVWSRLHSAKKALVNSLLP